MSCQVAGCRFSTTHTTQGHRCGTCGLFGHGQIECGSEERIQKLETHLNDVLPNDKHCCVRNCTTPWTHGTESHHCSNCGSLTRDPKCCVVYITRLCPMCKISSDVNVTLKIFTSSSCVVCFDEKPLCLFPSCGHAVVCSECTKNLQV